MIDSVGFLFLGMMIFIQILPPADPLSEFHSWSHSDRDQDPEPVDKTSAWSAQGRGRTGLSMMKTWRWQNRWAPSKNQIQTLRHESRP